MDAEAEIRRLEEFYEEHKETKEDGNMKSGILYQNSTLENMDKDAIHRYAVNMGITTDEVLYMIDAVLTRFTPGTSTEKLLSTIGQLTRKVAMIFGVTGQDGSYLSEILLEKGYEVVGVKRRSSTNNTVRISHIDDDNFTIVEGDVTDSDSVYNLVCDYKPTHIFNLAAQSHVGTSFKQPMATWESTANGCINILNVIKNVDTSIRFYQASTSEMFGKNYEVKYKDDPNAGPFVYNEDTDIPSLEVKYQDENTPFAPQSPYAVAKVAAHNMVSLYRDSYGLFACSGILFNHESPRRGENFVTRKITKYVAKVIDWFANNAAEFGTMNVYDIIEEYNKELKQCLNDIGPLELGNLDAHRDWGHAEDYCRGMVMMLEQDEPSDFVLATGETRTVRDFLKAAFGYYGHDYNKFVVINPEFFRPAEVDYLNGCPDKAERVLGWKRKYTFEELVVDMVTEDVKNNG